MMMLEQIKNGLVVSCQALPDEPLHSSFIMGRMAVAAKQAGAVGIRANSKEDIIEIKKQVDLPVIGIVKRDYEDSDVFITATMKEIHELHASGCDMVALDATNRLRPNVQTLSEFINEIRSTYPDMVLMADCATVEEVFEAERLGFDCLSTTLMGYTAESQGMVLHANDFEKLRTILNRVSKPVIAEGNIKTPAQAKRVIELGVHAVVVGSAITRPQLIAKDFAQAVESVDN